MELNIGEYEKVTYAPDNGYQLRFCTSFRKRRLKSKSKNKKTLICSGRIKYHMSEEEKEIIIKRVLANTTRFKGLPGGK